MLLDLINLKEKYNLDIKGVIHIGAHFGQEYETYEKLNIDKIIFFEPHPKSFSVLYNKLNNKKNIKLINCALGNQEGTIDMNIELANNGQSNSLLIPKKHLEQYPHIKFIDKIKVEINKLDNFLTEDFQYNFINIDVQGYELEVFKGSQKTLTHIDYIMTEINRDEVYENCVQINELDEYLNNLGFIRVETSWAGGTWGDAFYIKTKKND
jgi:FkbM family methyltransferase